MAFGVLTRLSQRFDCSYEESTVSSIISFIQDASFALILACLYYYLLIRVG